MRTRSKFVCTALLTASTLAVGPGGAGAAPAPRAPAASGTYTIVAGDTLFGIASRMKVRLQALLDANGLTVASLILPGQQLVAPAGAVVPAAKATKPGTNTPAAAGTTTTAAAAPAATGKTTAASTYTVVAGDYLYGIARRFAISFNGLLAANKMTATSAILPGGQLIIPTGATTTPAAAPAPSTEAAATTTTAPAATTTTAPKIAKPIAAPKLDIAPTGNAQIDAVLAFAKAQLGKPYVFAAAGPDTYDCSGLTLAAYAQAGVRLIPQSGMQSTQGTAVDFLNAPILPGDLVFTAGSSTPGVISHVGIAISSTRWIQATRPGAWVGVGAIPATSKILAVRRYIG